MKNAWNLPRKCIIQWIRAEHADGKPEVLLLYFYKLDDERKKKFPFFTLKLYIPCRLDPGDDGRRAGRAMSNEFCESLL